jgi:cytosine/adenosine deaminase-related metal-dependent hydrolase
MARNLIHANALVDYRGVIASPGAILREGNRIIAVGTPQDVGQIEDNSFTQLDGIVTPSFVNTHTHLDLSGVGIAPARESFVHWVDEVVLPIRDETEAVGDHVRTGIDLVTAGGSLIIGDIAGSLEAAEIVNDSQLHSVSFVELIGLGQRQHRAIELLQSLPPTFGISPHALYSCGKLVFESCFESGRKIATHLAESLEEIESVQQFQGALVEHAKRVGSWDDSVLPWNDHPIDAMLRVAGEVPFIAAHLNYVEDRHLPMLAASNITVAYCPRASKYFRHKNHRWMEMLNAGINVSLATDSLLCLDTPSRISVIDEMRLLYSDEQANPLRLLEMATVNGAVGLGFDPNVVSLTVGETAGLLVFESVGTNPILDIFTSPTMPTWL